MITTIENPHVLLNSYFHIMLLFTRILNLYEDVTLT